METKFMKKMIICAIFLALLTLGIPFTAWKYSATSTAADTENTTCIANPFEPCENMNEAEKIAGFSMKLPDIPDGFSLLELSAVKDDMVQAIYENQDLNLDIYLRKAHGSVDISGDYNFYPNQDQLIVSDKVVTLKGNGDKIMVATWTQESYTYAIDTDGISADIILDLIQQME